MSLTKTKTIVRKPVGKKPKVVNKIRTDVDAEDGDDIFSGTFQPASRLVLTFVANIEDNEKFFESLREYASTKKVAPKKSGVTPKSATKPLTLNENKWGNLVNGNGLLVFFEFETDCEWAEEGTTLMCIGYQNLKLDPDLDNPWTTILPLNEKSLRQFASLEKRTSEKIHCLNPENYEMITSEEQKTALVDFGLYVEGAEGEGDDEDAEGEDDLGDEAQPDPEVEVETSPQPIPKKKGWFSWIW